jgi:hypothetical protein
MKKVITVRMGLKVVDDEALTRDLSVFGLICFADGDILVYDEATGQKKKVPAKRGTIFVDPNVYFLRCLGCKHNTMAHEAYHWHKHRVYATVQSINSNKQVVAHRCPTAPRGNKINANQTPEDWMEWQANAVAPRILMPRAQTEIKVKEFLRKHGYIEQTEDSLQVLQAVIDELSEYYLVSKQAAKIRLLNFGYREAAEVYNYDTPDCLCPSKEATASDVFNEYRNNEDFRFLFDEGLFRNVEGYYVINADKYRTQDANGNYVLTEYAKDNLDECALTFEYNLLEIFEYNRSQGVMFKGSREPRPTKIFYPTANEAVINKALEEAVTIQRAFDSVKALGDETVAQTLTRYMVEIKRWKSSTFESKTGLSPGLFRKITTTPNKKLELYVLVSIWVGLDLPQGKSIEIIERAGYKLKPEILEDSVYLYILSTASLRNIVACNELIRKMMEDNEGYTIHFLGSQSYDGSGGD